MVGLEAGLGVYRVSFKTLSAISAMLFLTACGFQPLYGTREAGLDVPGQLSAIAIDNPTDRTTQLIRNHFISTTRTRGSNTNTRYKLSIFPRSQNDAAIRGFNTDVLRKSYHLNAKYTLADLASGKTILKGSTFSRVHFDTTAAPFSDYRAKADAQERAAREIADNIRTRIAAYFSAKNP